MAEVARIQKNQGTLFDLGTIPERIGYTVKVGPDMNTDLKLGIGMRVDFGDNVSGYVESGGLKPIRSKGQIEGYRWVWEIVLDQCDITKAG